MIRYSSVIANYTRNIRELISKYSQLVKKLEASIKQLEASLRKNKQGKMVLMAPTKESWTKLSLSEKQATFEAASFVNTQVNLLKKGFSATRASTTKKYVNMVGENLNKRLTIQRFNEVENNLATIEKFKKSVAKHDTTNWEIRNNKKEHIAKIKEKIIKEGYSNHELEADLIVARIYDEVYKEVMLDVKNGIVKRQDAWWEIHRRQNQRIKEAVKKGNKAFIDSLNFKHGLD